MRMMMVIMSKTMTVPMTMTMIRSIGGNPFIANAETTLDFRPVCFMILLVFARNVEHHRVVSRHSFWLIFPPSKLWHRHLRLLLHITYFKSVTQLISHFSQGKCIVDFECKSLPLYWLVPPWSTHTNHYKLKVWNSNIQLYQEKLNYR